MLYYGCNFSFSSKRAQNIEKEKKMEKNFIYEAPQSQFILFNDTDVISSSGGDFGDWDTDM